jgi:IS1 family transposase
MSTLAGSIANKFKQMKYGRLLAKRGERLNSNLGDQFVFVALNADTKLVSYFIVGKRAKETKLALLMNLQGKPKSYGRIQLTTDGFKLYIEAVEQTFGPDIDYARLIKVFGIEHATLGRYSPPKGADVLSAIMNGNPNQNNISTSYAERQNLTMRMQIRRLTRLTNDGFSKKIENLRAALTLNFVHYHFVWILRH